MLPDDYNKVNGAGWDVVYKCVENSGNYYGDCAG